METKKKKTRTRELTTEAGGETWNRGERPRERGIEEEESDGVVEREGEEIDGVVEREVEESDGAVEREVEESDGVVEREVEESDGAVEREEPRKGGKWTPRRGIEEKKRGGAKAEQKMLIQITQQK